ncbi:hypothetical protein [Modestobacter sp. KNN46-3]|uniref:hypothetical protein n=1 Tax=Modestobacter sp. KNN46-3 TaxID=2711218 RepID=UPI0013E064E2|nr:hypothetical protein [Modestobacter sp. KNN46-3]
MAVAVDDVDGTLHRLLDPKPGAAYLVGTDGTVLFRSPWADHPGPLRHALSAAAADQDGTVGQDALLPLPSRWEQHGGGGVGSGDAAGRRRVSERLPGRSRLVG